MDHEWARAWIGNDSRVVGRTRGGKTTQTIALSYIIASSVAEAIQRCAIMERDPEIVSTLEVALQSPSSWVGPTILDQVRT